MGLKKSWSKAMDWIGFSNVLVSGYEADIGSEGLINQQQNAEAGEVEDERQGNGELVVKPVQKEDKNYSIEKMQDGFNRLIDQLQGINKNLNSQMTQHEELMHHMEQMPELLQNLPEAIGTQKKIAGELIDQLRVSAVKQEQFSDVVEKIPAETAKQTDAIENMDRQLAASVEIEGQMVDNFGKFNRALDKLEQSMVSQTDGILQMSKTFATSDRYFKYIISKQSSRFTWLFLCSIGVCITVILTLTGIIIWLGQ